MASLRQQYGLRVQSDEFAGMGWDEFSDLVAGLGEQTPLARVAQVRTASDPEVVRRLTPEQRRMRSEWQRRRAGRRDAREVEDYLRMLQTAFSSAFGGE